MERLFLNLISSIQITLGNWSEYGEPYSPAARVDAVIAEALAAAAIDTAKRASRIYHFHADLAGASLDVTDEAGELTWAGQYTAWGKVEPSRRQLTVARTDQPLRYAGQYADDSTGLHYNTFRFYDPDVGRFINQDPIGLLGGDNLYQYAPSSTGWIDPLGLSFGSGKGTHTANASLFDSDGNLKATGTWQSGNITPSEAALGFPKNTLATHTEARITKDLSDMASPGDHLVIDGEYPPCNSCKGKMNAFSKNTGAKVTYNWEGNGEPKAWKAGC